MSQFDYPPKDPSSKSQKPPKWDKKTHVSKYAYNVENVDDVLVPAEKVQTSPGKVQFIRSEPVTVKPDTNSTSQKKVIWKGIAAFVVIGLAIFGAISEKHNQSKTSNTRLMKARPTSYEARQFVEGRLNSTVGNVVEIRQVGNGVYGGFPTGDSVFTFDGTCWTQYGSKNVVIAVECGGGRWFVRKVSIN